MALARLAGSTPVRQAVGIVAVVAIVNLVTLGLAWVGLRASTEQDLRANLAQNLASLQVAGSPRALEILVAAAADAADPAVRVFVFIAPDGRVTGNADAVLTRDGVEIRPRAEGRPLGEDGYLPQIEPMAGGILVVAESRTPLRRLRETFLTLLVLSLAPTVLVSLGAGAVIAARARARVERIEAALTRLGEGVLDVRIPEEPDRHDDLARIGARINRMAAAQEAATSALRQVSADIAHDLKTPLQRMSVLLADLRARLDETGAEAALADQAIAEAENAVAVFQGLLQIAQIEGGGSKAEMAPVDLVQLARGMEELYAPAAEDAGRSMKLDLPAGAVTVPGNRTLLGQALSNLIENALRHTPEGSPITVRVSATADAALLEVADSGPGIPEAERGKVLRRLYRLERSRTTPGHGLGLSLVAAIAGYHGADLTLADNAPGLKVTLHFRSAETSVEETAKA